ncbi:DUF2007 domain-containing protein [Mucilaginibacter litoreus]|uniref:DUF2007 domain-containing protein n=1 Tax=Mucilaginibacter litoreus TaxID=1048221 RepID=A0ABW3AVR5_9SPHI
MKADTDDNIITFERYYDPMLAHIVRTKLEDAGIPCFIADDNIIAANPLFNNAVGGIKLKIFERDLQRCREILEQSGNLHEHDHVEIDEESQAPVICPYCASTNVKHRLADQDYSTGIPGVLNTLIGFFKNQNEWHCYNCQRDFE